MTIGETVYDGRMARRLTLLGGHRDGEIVDDYGSHFRLPVPRPLTVFHIDRAPDVLPDAGFQTEEYRAMQDLDGRWFYVLEDLA